MIYLSFSTALAVYYNFEQLISVDIAFFQADQRKYCIMKRWWCSFFNLNFKSNLICIFYWWAADISYNRMFGNFLLEQIGPLSLPPSP